MASEELAKQVETYFDDWADDYESAVKGSSGRKPLQHLINVLFRRKTFRLRFENIAGVLENVELKDKRVLDVGCGTGQLALYIARQGATVTGTDISAQMIELCNSKAEKMGLSDKASFYQGDSYHEDLPQADVVMCIAVLEYYEDIAPFLQKLSNSTGDVLILCDARWIWWVVLLRKVLAAIKRFPVYYHDPAKVKAILQESGMACTEEYAINGFRTMVFKRSSADV